MGIFEKFKNRGLIKQTTGENKVRDIINGSPITFYIGFDPTAPSLHVGHLLQLVAAKRLINGGHKFVALIGGATAMIGDVTGKTEMRKLMSKEDVDFNIASINKQLNNIMGDNNFILVNNNDWFQTLDCMFFIREVGMFFQVNNMLRAECFKARLNNGGLSFMEFAYMLMQGFDFYWLHKEKDCVLQVGGDDQWSNILAGVDLVHKKNHKEVFGLTLPLLLNSDGEKMGKTMGGAVWLDEDKTSPFEFFQYWRNIADTDVDKCFRLLTFLPLNDIEEVMGGDINEAKKRLAKEITAIVHTKEVAEQAGKKAEDIFENDKYEEKKIENKEYVSQELVMLMGWATSKSAAKRLMDGNGVKIKNGSGPDILKADQKVSRDIYGDTFTLFKGKKEKYKVRFI